MSGAYSIKVTLMETLLGCCGLDCHGCPIHLATLESDEAKKHEMRSEIARICNECYGLALAAHDVNDCDGCRSSRLFVRCAQCDIRSCATERDLESCAFCDRYPCERLAKMLDEEPAARQGLEKLRESPGR